jgi:hypothetical protein
MYHTASIIPDPADAVEVDLHDIPVIRFRGIGGDLSIHVPHETPEQAIAWLRRLAVAAEELAEQVELLDRPGLALAEQYIGEMKAAAGIGAR